jgi:Ca-activated chloride channel family protein
MSKLRLALLALLLTVGVFHAASSARQEAGQVLVPLSAVDRDGQPFEGLKAEDLRVTVEGQQQNVLSLARRADEPLHVVIMLDASASQERVLPFTQGAADRLVPALLARGAANDVAVVSFTGELKVVQGLTADPALVRRAIASVEFEPPSGYIGGGVLVGNPLPNDPSGSTAVWDGLVGVCEKVFGRARAGRRVVLLITDGVDTSSRLNLDDAVKRLLREGVTVYGVGVGDEKSFEGVDAAGVRKISERTGGRALFPKKNSDLPEAFEQVRRELLNSSYALTLAAPPAPRGAKPLKLRVELVNPELRKRDVRLAYPQALVR